MDTIINIGAFILEDDVEMHAVMMDAILEKNLTAEITEDPDKFLSKLKTSDINVIILDHRLAGDITGLDMIKEVKKINKWSIVIVMTGQTRKNVVEDYINAGANKYIDKNWDEKKLKQILGDFPTKAEHPDYIDVLVKFLKEGIEEAKERVLYVKFMDSIRPI